MYLKLQSLLKLIVPPNKKFNPPKNEPPQMENPTPLNPPENEIMLKCNRFNFKLTAFAESSAKNTFKISNLTSGGSILPTDSVGKILPPPVVQSILRL